ncbi:hypothetical protein [Streptomyces sp. NPDC058665]|uniref:hypothetical protein n=1 Tax=Streptomyces sp. NPDC058665 TaxID=3346586 RepID=UPI00364BC6AA
MARILILTGISGLGFSWRKGELVDLDDDEAAKWADGVRAEYADTPPPPPPADDDPADPFDPVLHPSREVFAYLDTVGESEALRVYELEAAGENRAGINKQKERVLERARARDAELAAATGPAEVAAESSRGGGRGDGPPETR